MSPVDVQAALSQLSTITTIQHGRMGSSRLDDNLTLDPPIDV